MKRPIITNNVFYHIYNRGVEKRKIFLDEQDHLRFIHDLFEFNNLDPAPSLTYHFDKHSKEVGLPKIKRQPRKLLVELLVYCLMPNHFHIIAKQRIDGGVTTFMRKLGTGYTNYFNQKYERVGSLFQGKYKIVQIKKEPHFFNLPCYVHLNPLDLIIPDWKENKEVKDTKKAINFLENYRWSSFPDYIGKKNFPSVIQHESFSKFLGSPAQYKIDTIEWLKSSDLKGIKEVSLEK